MNDYDMAVLNTSMECFRYIQKYSWTTNPEEIEQIPVELLDRYTKEIEALQGRWQNACSNKFLHDLQNPGGVNL